MALRYKFLWLQSVKNLNKTYVVAMAGLTANVYGGTNG